jgi:thiol-disulfide isomerase/thioredoxin
MNVFLSMKKPQILLVFAFSLLLAHTATAQKARMVKLPELLSVLEAPGEEIRVINFWATWCGPCVKEMPLFEKLTRERKDVVVTLVSMDMDLDPNPEKVHKFVSRKKLESTVLILDENNPNEYIDKIEKQWSGALPATIILNSKTGKRIFVEKELHEGDLEKLIDQVR